ncbi:MAG: rhodanese domain protein [Firmicutes bacterium]|nr:rhodanese domain protein [Bacillota bacterium]
MKNFVSAAWLNANLNRGDIVIADCRGDLLDRSYGRREFETGHIEGAAFLDIREDLSSEQVVHGGRNPLPDIAILKKTLERAGIGNDTTVVAYDELKIANAARLCWMLRYIGHTKNFILDGGIKKWLGEGYTLAKDKEYREPGNLEISVNEGLIADAGRVEGMKAGGGACLIDSRTEQRYRGEKEPIDPVAGRIPGAVNFYWKNSLKEDGTICSEQEIRDRFKGVEKFGEVIVYCGSGIDAAFNFMLLDEIGIKSRLYVGSFSDWITYPGNKIERGV